jgi:hypothetical protein
MDGEGVKTFPVLFWGGKGMGENFSEKKMTFEIFFRDLKPETQKNLCETFKTTEQDENWDVFPLFTLEREDGEVS